MVKALLCNVSSLDYDPTPLMFVTVCTYFTFPSTTLIS
jgi:hypothetical protein